MSFIRRIKASGFTLIEIVIVLTISFALLGGGIELYRLAYNIYAQQQDVLEADAQGRLAILMMTNDLHAIRSTSDITSATPTSLTFTDLNGQSVTYQLSGSQLMRNSNVLTDYVQSLAFQYYNSSGTELSSPINTSLIRYISLSITIHKTNNFNFTAGITLWNVM